MGDIIKINSGILIPCDGYIIKALDIKVDESVMTGETDDVQKDTLKNIQQNKNNK